MDCPGCSAAMIVVEHSQIELDYCLDCKGLWFDADELKLLVEAFDIEADLPDVASLPLAHTPEKKRACPRCGKKMDKIHMGKEPRILIDRCPKGHGLWFDSGELVSVIRRHAAASQDHDQGIVAFLGEVLSGSEKNKSEGTQKKLESL